MVRPVALLLTLLTGFAGLVYEVAWQRYLATLLGSHSEAAAAVLAIFLGGLSIGYWLFGALTRRLVDRALAEGRPPRLLLFYGFVEGGIGVFAIAFPWFFDAVRALSYLLPHGAEGVGFAIDVALSALLIGLPSVLMGGTIPVLTQALAHDLDDATRFHAYVYGMNTAGAFLGALSAGFYLVPALGLAKVMLAMGAMNVVAGGIFITLGLRGRAVELPSADSSPSVPGFAYYAGAALLVGFAAMALQTVSLRMAAIALGSTQFSFSMVVAVFVLCIALGSFAVSLLPRISNAVIVANQWLLALLVLALYAPFPEIPYRVYVLRTLFSDENPAFYAFYFSAFLALLLFIGPAVVLSGASLPLLFHHLRRQVAQLGDVAGKLYSWNTVGSLLGALLAGYALLFWLDLHHIFRIAVAALILAAALVSAQVYAWPRSSILAAIPLWGLLTMFGPWDAKQFNLPTASVDRVLPHAYDGIDRFLEENSEVAGPPILHHDDDPTSTVTIREYKGRDGKLARALTSDGRGDGSTEWIYGQSMRLLALLPAIMAEKAERAFVVGFGIGMTAGEIGRIDTMREVTVVEISPGVVTAAPFFEFANLGPVSNPVVEIVRSDAYRALMRSDGSYDVIVSQPSHLWVTGVEMVMSREFLETAHDRLSPGGVFGQWIPETGIDAETTELVLRTFLSVFENVSIWETRTSELILLGFKDPGAGKDHFRVVERANSKTFSPGLKRADIQNGAALLVHERVPVGVLRAADLDGPIHTLLKPRLNDLAARALFRREYGRLPFAGYGAPADVGASNSLLGGYTRTHRDGLTDTERGEIVNEACATRVETCLTHLAAWKSDDPDSPAVEAAIARHARMIGLEEPGTFDEVSELFSSGGGRSSEWVPLNTARRISEQFVRFYNHGVPFGERSLLDVWSRCRTGLRSPELCRSEAKLRREQDPTMEDAEFDRLVAVCIETPLGGPDCQQGLNEARVLLESGVVPEPTSVRRRSNRGPGRIDAH